MDVFCGDGWRIFEWELGCEALPMDLVNGCMDCNLILNDDELWNVSEMLSRPDPIMESAAEGNLLFQPTIDRDLRLSPRKRDRRILSNATVKDFSEHQSHCMSSAAVSNSEDCIPATYMALNPLASAANVDERIKMGLGFPEVSKDKTQCMSQAPRHPLNAMETQCEALATARLIYSTETDHLEENLHVYCEPRAKKTKTNATSQFKGVTKHRQTGKYEAHLWDATVIRRGKERRGRKRGKQIYLGGFQSELAAARTYDMAAICFWGDAANTNFPMDDYAADRELLKTTDKQSIVKILRRSCGGYRMGSQIFVGLTLGGFLDDASEAIS